MFSQSHQFTVNGGSFLSVAGDYIQVQKRLGFDILLEGVAKGALHNSGERFDPPKCHPNTRTAVLQKIMDWIQDQDPSSPDLMWIYGPAGSGKSAIGQSIAELCFELGLLIGTFFFSRSVAGRNDDICLVATIAYQIALSFPEARPLIEKAVEHDPALLSRDLEAQLKALIVEPLSRISETLASNTGPQPRLILIDGLDECQGPRSQTTIIHAFSQLITLHKLPLAILFASRSEPRIKETFHDKAFETNLRRIALDNTLHPDDDIREFLTSRFKNIRDAHQMKFYVPEAWPPRDAIDELVAKSSGQFIYASIVIKYVESHGHRPPARLDAVLQLQSNENTTPFAELDNLYMHILSCVEDYGLVSKILGFLLQPVHDIGPDEHTPGFIDSFFSLQEGGVYLSLNNLHSIVAVPSPEHEDSITMTHASFGDFLFDRSRSGIYFLEPSRVHADLAIRCMQNIAEHRGDINKYRIYMHSVRALMEHCSRARLTPELLESLSSFDLLTWIKIPKWESHDRNRSEVLQWLPRYFAWLSNEIVPGAQSLFKQHVKIFDQYLHSEIREYHYDKKSVQCYMTFEGSLSLHTCALLSGRRRDPLSSTSLLVGTDSLNVTSMGEYRDAYVYRDYSNFLRQFSSDKKRAGRYALTRDTRASIALLVLQQLRFGSLWASQFDTESIWELNLSAQTYVTSLPIILAHSSPSNELFHCVSSFLTECENEDSSLEAFFTPEFRVALSDYLQRCKDDLPFSFRRLGRHFRDGNSPGWTTSSFPFCILSHIFKLFHSEMRLFLLASFLVLSIGLLLGIYGTPPFR